jgi:radical SAM superfamily enzyme YgiQ (UPF0313 family)
MKILLVTPVTKEPFSQIWPTLGLCYLSSYLKSKGYDSIDGIDLNINTWEDLENAIHRNDLIGIYCSTKGVTSALSIAQLAKVSGKIVVMGGPHVSVLPKEILTKEYVDFVILSEGEESFYELLKALKDDTSYYSIDGFGYKKDGQIVINPKTRYIKNLDEIPFPDRDLFEFDYSNEISFCATRGCPYKCANCQPALSIQTCAFRMRSIDNIITEMKSVAKGKYVHFVDNDLSVNKRWLRNLCERLISEKINILWDCQCRVNTLNLELMKIMKKAGYVSIGLGIESGSQSLLDSFLHKQIKLERAKELFEESKKIKMPLHCWYIIGIPTETKEEIELTIKFALENDVASVGFSIGTPWPGTVFYKVASENGWILAKNWDEYNEKRYSRLRTDNWGPEDIAFYRELIIERFSAKGWHVNENDFIFINPYYGFSSLTIALRNFLLNFLGETRLQRLKASLGSTTVNKLVEMINTLGRLGK